MPSDWKINACQCLLSSLKSYSRGCSGVDSPLVCVKNFQKISEAEALLEALKFGNFTPQNKKLVFQYWVNENRDLPTSTKGDERGLESLHKCDLRFNDTRFLGECYL